MAVKPIPEGYTTATPYLICRDAVGAIEYYKNAFEATEVFRMADPSGKVMHAEIRIGNAMLMLADEHPQMNCRSPKAYGGTPVFLMIYVPEVDKVFNRALKLGGTSVHTVKNQFYGDRLGCILDPFGHSWYIATHIEDVSPEELKRRASEHHG